MIRWPLQSRRNLAIVVTAVLLSGVVVGRLTGPSQAATAPTTTAPTAAPMLPVDPTPTYTPETKTPTVEPTRDIYLDVARVAEEFTKAWARPDLPRQEWLAGVAPWITPRLAKSLATTDPARVPATKVTSFAVMFKIGDVWAWVRVPTDAGNMVASMVSKPSPACESVCDTWLVNDIAKEAPE